MRRKRGVGVTAAPSWAIAQFIRSIFQKRHYKEMGLAKQKYLNMSTSQYANFLTASLIILLIRAESTQLL